MFRRRLIVVFSTLMLRSVSRGSVLFNVFEVGNHICSTRSASFIVSFEYIIDFPLGKYRIVSLNLKGLDLEGFTFSLEFYVLKGGYVRTTAARKPLCLNFVKIDSIWSFSHVFLSKLLETTIFKKH